MNKVKNILIMSKILDLILVCKSNLINRWYQYSSYDPSQNYVRKRRRITTVARSLKVDSSLGDKTCLFALIGRIRATNEITRT